MDWTLCGLCFVSRAEPHGSKAGSVLDSGRNGVLLTRDICIIHAYDTITIFPLNLSLLSPLSLEEEKGSNFRGLGWTQSKAVLRLV